MVCSGPASFLIVLSVNCGSWCGTGGAWSRSVPERRIGYRRYLRGPTSSWDRWPPTCWELRAGLLTAIAEGEEDPEVLADMAKGRLREKLEELREALQGVVGSHQRFMLRTQLASQLWIWRLSCWTLRLPSGSGRMRMFCRRWIPYPAWGVAHCGDDCGGDGDGHGQIRHPWSPGFVGWGESWEQPKCGQEQAKSDQEG